MGRKDGMEPTGVVAGIIWINGRYLAVRRPKGKYMAGFWEFPGGKIENGETPAQALVRELGEELAILPTIYHPWREKFHRYPELHVHVRFYLVTGFEGRPRARERQRMAWVAPKENRLPFLPADLDIVAELATAPELASPRPQI